MIRVKHKPREGYERKAPGCGKLAVELDGYLPCPMGTIKGARTFHCRSCGEWVWLVFSSPDTMECTGVEAWTVFEGERH